ncbi:hypothetical protein [Galbitalea soli]|uniref:Uncharacterized protein n=1 Tax=Galbitalea soli TaxID=1268042 RepID=A0A7C9PPG8_9MICO|nr:hypothetical protein [Galbitalea soli]NEM92151.1 hypothetical protein [Galbitalea soli]NYJ31896.1 hypothetical protein [Galbitalea soli]
MIGIRLFARTRRWLANVVIALATGILMLACGPLGYGVNPRGGYLVELTAQLPLLPAIAIAASSAASARVQERLAVRNLVAWRLAHVAVLSVIAAVIAGGTTLLLPAPAGLPPHSYAGLGSLALMRNVFALTGAALGGSFVFGPRLGWIVPMGWAILPFLAFTELTDDAPGLATLVLQPDDAFAPMIFALLVWGIGATVAATDPRGARPQKVSPGHGQGVL